MFIAVSCKTARAFAGTGTTDTLDQVDIEEVEAAVAPVLPPALRNHVGDRETGDVAGREVRDPSRPRVEFRFRMPEASRPFSSSRRSVQRPIGSSMGCAQSIAGEVPSDRCSRSVRVKAPFATMSPTRFGSPLTCWHSRGSSAWAWSRDSSVGASRRAWSDAELIHWDGHLREHDKATGKARPSRFAPGMAAGASKVVRRPSAPVQPVAWSIDPRPR